MRKKTSRTASIIIHTQQAPDASSSRRSISDAEPICSRLADARASVSSRVCWRGGGREIEVRWRRTEPSVRQHQTSASSLRMPLASIDCSFRPRASSTISSVSCACSSSLSTFALLRGGGGGVDDEIRENCCVWGGGGYVPQRTGRGCRQVDLNAQQHPVVVCVIARIGRARRQ